MRPLPGAGLALPGSGRRADEGGDVLGGAAGELGQHGGVGVGGDRDAGQAAGFLDDFHVVPAGQELVGSGLRTMLNTSG